MLTALIERALVATTDVVFRSSGVDAKEIPVAITQNAPLDLESIVNQTSNGLNLHAIVGHPGHTVFRVLLPVQTMCLIKTDPRFTGLQSFLDHMQRCCPRGFDYVGYEQTSGRAELLYSLKCPNEINQPLTYYSKRSI